MPEDGIACHDALRTAQAKLVYGYATAAQKAAYSTPNLHLYLCSANGSSTLTGLLQSLHLVRGPPDHMLGTAASYIHPCCVNQSGQNARQDP